MRFLMILIAATLTSAPTFAQELGLLGGFHQTTAESANTTYSDDGKIGYKLGALARFEMSEPFSFRSGLIYTARNFDLNAPGIEVEYKFSYLDVPALIDYRLNDVVGFYGGLSIGINVADEAKINGVDAGDIDTESMIALGQVGASFLFQDMFSLDVYYERGLGDIANSVKDYSTFGANFVYWLY